MGNPHRASYIQPPTMQLYDSGAIGGNGGSGGVFGPNTPNGANPLVGTQQARQYSQHGVQGPAGDGSSSVGLWRASSIAGVTPQISASTSTPASAASVGSAPAPAPASATSSYRPDAFAGVTPRPASYHASAETMYTSAPTSSHGLSIYEPVSHGYQFENSFVHQEPPPLPVRVPSSYPLLSIISETFAIAQPYDI